MLHSGVAWRLVEAMKYSKYFVVLCLAVLAPCVLAENNWSRLQVRWREEAAGLAHTRVGIFACV